MGKKTSEWMHDHALGIITSVVMALLIGLIVLFVLSARQCSVKVREAGGLTGIISEMVVDIEEMAEDIQKEVEKEREEREAE